MTFLDRRPHAQRQLSDLSDLDRLWFAQFGQMAEVWPRVVCVIASAIGLWAYDGSLAGPIWAVAYLSGLLVSYYTMRPANPNAPAAIGLGYASHIYIVLAFAAFPLMLIAAEDLVLTFCGIFGIVGLGAFTLFREEPPSAVQPLDIVVGWAAIVIIAVKYIPNVDSLAAQGVMAMLCVVVGGYYTLALLTTRSMREDLRTTMTHENEAHEMAAVGRLSGGMAHDFNNILTAVQGSLELYHEVPPGPERDALVDEARAASARATTLVSQLLAFARRAPMDPAPQSAAQVLDTALEEAQRALPSDVQIDVRLPDQPVQVLADVEGLRAALSHLVRNAGEAVGAQGTIVLAADVARGSAIDADNSVSETLQNAHVCFSVSDDGPGMTDKVLSRATEPFFTTKTVGYGSGLGLSTAQGFAEQAGGALRIKSSDNGTRVTLHLPLAS